MEHRLKRGLIVSCQAVEGEPLYGYHIMPLLAKAAAEGGAAGIRALAEDVGEIKRSLDIPVIGLCKRCYPDSEIYITPTKREVDEILETGCDVLAMDATLRSRPGGETLEELVRYVRSARPGLEIMADVAEIDEARAADELGFDYVSTTLRGYTKQTENVRIPDIKFMRGVGKALKSARLIAEGGIFEQRQLAKISRLNPYAVVVGSAITRPKVITERFIRALKLRSAK